VAGRGVEFYDLPSEQIAHDLQITLKSVPLESGETLMPLPCPGCGAQPTVRIVEAYPFTESGLDSVVLRNLEQSACGGCEETSVAIPKLTGLHHSIAVALVHKPHLLTGKEICFLRKVLGYSTAELAVRLYTSPQDVEYWELGDVASWGATDRLIRTIFMLKAKFQGLWPSDDYGKIDRLLMEIQARRTPQEPLAAEFDSEAGQWNVWLVNGGLE